MRIAAPGSGGIGGYYGMLLAKAGLDVTFIARGAHLEAMQRRGLTVRTPQADAVDRVVAQAATLPPQWRSSMPRDLDDGRRLEVEALSGAVVRRGLAHGIPIPVHQTIAACLSVHQPTTAATH